eukprot:EG_transcript_2505
MCVEKVLPPISIATHKAAKDEIEYKLRHGVPQYFTCKMNYPYTVTGATVRGSIAKRADVDGQAATTEDEGPEEQLGVMDQLEGCEDIPNSTVKSMEEIVAGAFERTPAPQQPNPYWTQPPPTFEPVPDLVSQKVRLRKDEWHPLLATATAAQVALQQGSNAITVSSPKATTASQPVVPNRSEVNSESGEPSLTVTAALLLSKALFHPVQSHAIPVNAILAANRPRPATDPDARFQQTSRTVQNVHLNNNHQNKTFNDLNNVALPPPSAFRALSDRTRHTLQTRGTKTRSHLEHQLQQSFPVVVPPPRQPPPPPPAKEEEGPEGEGEEEEDAAGAEGAEAPAAEPPVLAQALSSASLSASASAPAAGPRRHHAATEVRYNPLTGDWEIVTSAEEVAEEAAQDEEEDEEDDMAEEQAYSLEAAMGMDSLLHLWTSSVHSKDEQENKAVDPSHVPSPLEAVAGKRRVKVVTSNLVSLYDPAMRRPMLQRYLCGQGQRNGSTLIVTAPNSTSSFTSALPEYLRVLNMRSPSGALGPTSGIGPTPAAAFAAQEEPCAFAFKDENLGALIMDKGRDIEEVTLEGESWISEAALLKIAEYCPNLKLLNLSGCTQLSGPTLARIAEGCPQLVFLSLSGCPQIPGEAVAQVLAHCRHIEALCLSGLKALDCGPTTFRTLHASPALRAVDLSYCSTVTDASLVAIARYCNALEWLNLSGCTAITDVGVAAVGNHLSKLRVLIMKLCSQPALTAAGLGTISNAPRNLRRLDLSGVLQLDDATLLQILRKAPVLRSLSVSGCPNVTDEAVRALSVYCPDLQALDMASCQHIAIQTLMDLIHDVPSFIRLVVTNSCISAPEVRMLQEVRRGCRIIRTEPRPQRGMRVTAVKPPP